MNRLYLPGQRLRGSLAIMPSKSASHRALISAALARGQSVVSPLQLSEDIEATLRCLRSLGLLGQERYEPSGTPLTYGRCRVEGIAPAPSTRPRTVFCGESGSTLRFLLPLALDGGAATTFTGAGRLLERPLSPYESCFRQKGLSWSQDAAGITVQGRLPAGEYVLPGDVSSQFITGLLFALPRVTGDSVIRLTSPLESVGYVHMTLQALAAAGVRAWFEDERTLRVPGGQAYHSGDFRVPGDWSHAAFYLVAGAMGGDLTLTGLDPRDAQGDRAIRRMLEEMGARIQDLDGGLHVQGGVLGGTALDVRDVPDLVPALCVAACAAQGRTEITGAARLRLKESDRLSAMAAELGKLGAKIEEKTDGLVIEGGRPLRHAVVEGHGDHRIVMALAMAASLCEGGVTLQGAQAVRKSAPSFFEEILSLGGEVIARDMG